jgi:hypothetical protein
VAVIYAVLGVVIFLPGEGSDFEAQMVALGSLIGLGLLVWAYATWTVPWMRRRWAGVESKRRRRPGA